jgi:hypothetical protein
MYILINKMGTLHKVKEVINDSKRRILVKLTGLSKAVTIKKNNAKSDYVIFQSKPARW